ncbi:MAG: phospholipase D-like domain-containing protein, partial [Desulfobulbus sp.]|nr:phospholipase D-like domain-containing protein [Desulfobulbus sp.]
FFNFLTLGYTPARNYKKLKPSPRILKKTLMENIKREIEHQSKGNQGLIQLKSNALTDMDVIAALYQASQAGVKVELIIRDSCLLRPGIPGLSDNIRVMSIVGRFLEHARIYYFRNNGQEEYYIGSADLMKRNLEHRVEVMAPIESPALQNQLREILNLQMADRRGAWEMQADGTYMQRRPEAKEEKRSAQELLIEKSEKRLAEARRLYKKQSSKKIAKRKSKNK